MAIALTVLLGLNIQQVYAGNNFISIRLPNGISIDVPRNWQIATNDQRITIDTAVESQLDLSKIPNSKSDLGFVAVYYDNAGDKAKISIRYYPDIVVSQETIRRANPTEISKFDTGLRTSTQEALEAFGGTVLSWGGTKKRDISNRVALFTEYRRTAYPGEQGSFSVNLIRILDGPKSFTLTISYNELYKPIFKPICEKVISSLEVITH